MDKEDCIQVLLSTLQQPLWKSCDSVTDWDLKNVLWKAGLLLTPEQLAALFADIKRRGLVSAGERRVDDRIVALWGVRITPAGEGWLAHLSGAPVQSRQVVPPVEPTVAEEEDTIGSDDPPIQAATPVFAEEEPDIRLDFGMPVPPHP